MSCRTRRTVAPLPASACTTHKANRAAGDPATPTLSAWLLQAEAAGLRELLVSAEDGSLRFDCSGHLFLDSNPRTFEVVLDFLRDGAAALPSSQFELQKLWIDARKFRVRGASEVLRDRLAVCWPGAGDRGCQGCRGQEN